MNSLPNNPSGESLPLIAQDTPSKLPRSIQETFKMIPEPSKKDQEILEPSKHIEKLLTVNGLFCIVLNVLALLLFVVSETSKKAPRRFRISSTFSKAAPRGLQDLKNHAKLQDVPRPPKDASKTSTTATPRHLQNVPRHPKSSQHAPKAPSRHPTTASKTSQHHLNTVPR